MGSRLYRRYSEEQLRDAVSSSVSIAGVLRNLGIRPAGGSHAHISRRIIERGYDTTHFTGQRTNHGSSHRGGPAKRQWDEILILRSTGQRAKPHLLNRALIEMGRTYECAKCGCGKMWCGDPIALQVDHKNRNWLDDRPENLTFLCPNCHSQTDGWCGRKPNARMLER